MDQNPQPQTNGHDQVDLEKKEPNSTTVNNPKDESKQKRHRRSKNDSKGRDFKCPDCGKCYLSSPALTNHRKTKHEYGKDGEKKGRGRPRKEPSTMNPSEITEQKFITFFESSIRKKTDEEPITSELLKTNLNNVFRMCKSAIFQSIESITDYSFYNVLVDNWEKELHAIPCESYSSVLNQQQETPLETTLPIDGSLFLYLKEVSKKTNKDYFWFLLKFVVVFRECLNTLRKKLIQPQHIKDNKTEYTQIYNAETVPAICNEFFYEFMDVHQYFGLNDNECIETIQHLCSWLYTNGYTKSQLTTTSGKN